MRNLTEGKVPLSGRTDAGLEVQRFSVCRIEALEFGCCSRVWVWGFRFGSGRVRAFKACREHRVQGFGRREQSNFLCQTLGDLRLMGSKPYAQPLHKKLALSPKPCTPESYLDPPKYVTKFASPPLPKKSQRNVNGPFIVR